MKDHNKEIRSLTEAVNNLSESVPKIPIDFYPDYNPHNDPRRQSDSITGEIIPDLELDIEMMHWIGDNMDELLVLVDEKMKKSTLY